MDRRLQILLPLLYLLLSQSSQTILLAAIGWAITNGLIDISTVPGRVAWALQRPGDFFKFFGTRTELGTWASYGRCEVPCANLVACDRVGTGMPCK